MGITATRTLPISLLTLAAPRGACGRVSSGSAAGIQRRHRPQPFPGALRCSRRARSAGSSPTTPTCSCSGTSSSSSALSCSGRASLFLQPRRIDFGPMLIRLPVLGLGDRDLPLRAVRPKRDARAVQRAHAAGLHRFRAFCPERGAQRFAACAGYRSDGGGAGVRRDYAAHFTGAIRSQGARRAQTRCRGAGHEHPLDYGRTGAAAGLRHERPPEHPRRGAGGIDAATARRLT